MKAMVVLRDASYAERIIFSIKNAFPEVDGAEAKIAVANVTIVLVNLPEGISFEIFCGKLRGFDGVELVSVDPQSGELP